MSGMGDFSEILSPVLGQLHITAKFLYYGSTVSQQKRERGKADDN